MRGQCIVNTRWIFIFLFVFSFHGIGVSQTTSIKWYDFTATDQSVIAKFPNKPICKNEGFDERFSGQIVTFTQQTCSDNSLEGHSFEIKRQFHASVLGKDFIDIAKIVPSSMYEALGMKITETQIRSDGCNGLEIRGEDKDGLTSIQRLFTIGKTFYSINVVSERNTPASAKIIQSFYDSFHFARQCK